MTGGDVSQAVERVDAALDALAEVDLSVLHEDALLRATEAIERLARRMESSRWAVASEVDARGLASTRGCATTAVLLAQLLRLSRGEARARMTAAGRFVSRCTVTGESLPPELPQTARAVAEGAVSPPAAAIIGDTIDALPDEVDVRGEIPDIEAFLVEQARVLPPEAMRTVSRRLIETIDPDGVLRDSRYRERRRELVIHRRPDGSVHGRFDGTAEFGEVLQTVLDVTAAPRPSADGARDDRSGVQRQHDGLLEALRLVLRSGELPSAHGVLATVVLTMTAGQWASERGLATTGHGALVPVGEAKRIVRGECRLFPVVLGGSDPPAERSDRPPIIARLFRTARPVSAYGTSQRFFTERARLAMAARDRGCTHPGCPVPAALCEADHVTDWKDTGRTSVDDGHLACGFHHRLKADGWQTVMLDGLPHWIAPAWLDPTRTPQRNRLHDPVVV